MHNQCSLSCCQCIATFNFLLSTGIYACDLVTHMCYHIASFVRNLGRDLFPCVDPSKKVSPFGRAAKRPTFGVTVSLFTHCVPL